MFVVGCSFVKRLNLAFWAILCVYVLSGVVTVSAQTKSIKICVNDARSDQGLNGATVSISTSEFTVTGTTGINGCRYLDGAFPVTIDDEQPAEGRLSADAPYPNPASSQLSIPVTVPRTDNLQIQVFDVQGRRISVPNEVLPFQAGATISLSISDLADGIYFYKISGAAGVATGTFIKQRHVGSTPMPQGRSVAGHTLNKLAVSMEDSVTVGVSREGFETLSEKRRVHNYETVQYTLFKVSQEPVPLIDMYGVKYLDRYFGGLYPDQQNEIPEQHLDEGLALARDVEPLDAAGNPDGQGKIIMTSIGMSTTSSIFCGVADPNDRCKGGTFMDVLTTETGLHPQLVVIDGADPGKTAEKWEDPMSSAFNRVTDEELTPFGWSDQQVQVAWINLASSQPTQSLPHPDADALTLKRQYGNVMRAMKQRYPNLKLVFFASRVYGGYATTTLNPEPYAFEAGLAVKWAIEAQIQQMAGDPVDADTGDLNYSDKAPWMAWGPYLWADGTNPRSDGLVWLPEDLKEDGTHLNRPGIEKITPMLLDFFKTSRLTRCWFVNNGEACE